MSAAITRKQLELLHSKTSSKKSSKTKQAKTKHKSKKGRETLLETIRKERESLVQMNLQRNLDMLQKTDEAFAKRDKSVKELEQIIIESKTKKPYQKKKPKEEPILDDIDDFVP